MSGSALGSPFEERLPPLRGKMSCSDKRGSLSPQVTERAQAVRLVAKVLGAMRKLPVVLLPLPLGEVDLRSKDGEGARR